VPRWVLLAILAIGIGLRTVQYLADTSLWLDEVALVKGILGFDLTDLVTRPLPYDQVAPKGFLIAQKSAVVAFGQTDYVLRLVPFVCSVAALVAFASLAARALSPIAASVATLLFATAAPLVTFAGTVKQYSTDVCVAVILSWIALDLISRPVTRRLAWLAAISGALLQWFSQPAVLVAAGLAIPVMMWTSTIPPDARRQRVGLVVGMWAASAVAVTASALATMSPETRDYMRLYWADGLAPSSLGELMRSGWPLRNIRRLFRGGFGAQAALGYPLFPLYLALAAIGVARLWRRQKRVALVLTAPLVVTLSAAAAQQYPFSDRLILFLVPLALLGIGEVSAAAAERFSKPLAGLAVLGICVLGVLPIASTLPPYRVEDVKAVLRHVQTKRQPDDEVYVYYAAAPVMSFYDAAFGFTHGTYAVGGCHRGESRRYFEELDTFRGRPRVWVIVTHSLPGYREREDIVAYLDAIGTRSESVSIASRAVGNDPLPAEGFLYDLSAPARLAAAESGSFTVTGPDGANQQNTCANGPHTMIRSDFECTGPPDSRCTRRPSVDSAGASGER
jgi:hypothetical protein